MKAIIRLLIILLAAFAVTGATWAIGQSSGNSSDSAFVQGKRPDFGESEGRPAPPAGREGRAGGDHHAAQWTSVRGWLGFAETLVPITIIIILVTLPASLWKRYQRARHHTAATAA